MSMVSVQADGVRAFSGAVQSRPVFASRSSVSCKSATGVQDGATAADPEALSTPEWDLYQQYAAKYVEDPAYQQLVGWKTIPELINGRLCMLEVVGGKTVLAQLAAGPQAVFFTSLLVVIGSCVPAVKGVKGDYVEALKDNYTLPKGVFTEPMERVHGRLAMVAMFTMILFETISGKALL